MPFDSCGPPCNTPSSSDPAGSDTSWFVTSPLLSLQSSGNTAHLSRGLGSPRLGVRGLRTCLAAEIEMGKHRHQHLLDARFPPTSPMHSCACTCHIHERTFTRHTCRARAHTHTHHVRPSHGAAIRVRWADGVRCMSAAVKRVWRGAARVG